MAQDEALQQAVNDLAMVRRSIEKLRGEQGQAAARAMRTTWAANLGLHVIAMILALGLAALDGLTSAFGLLHRLAGRSRERRGLVQLSGSKLPVPSQSVAGRRPVREVRGVGDLGRGPPPRVGRGAADALHR
jgi:hypothetical protein